MMKTILYGIALTILISCSDTSNTNGFDTACKLLSEGVKRNLSPEELGQYISDGLISMPNQEAKIEVIEAYHALFNADPALRYQLFKESAEMTLGREWSCPAMEKLDSGADEAAAQPIH